MAQISTEPQIDMSKFRWAGGPSCAQLPACDKAWWWWLAMAVAVIGGGGAKYARRRRAARAGAGAGTGR